MKKDSFYKAQHIIVFLIAMIIAGVTGYIIVAEDWEKLDPGRKIREKNMAQMRQQWRIQDAYSEQFYALRDQECADFYKMKNEKLDSMRVAHRMAETEISARADKHYRAAVQYNYQIRDIDSVLAAIQNDTVNVPDTTEYVAKKQDLIKKSKQHLAQGDALLRQMSVVERKNDSVWMDVLENYNFDFQHPENLMNKRKLYQIKKFMDLYVRKVRYNSK
ncbi:MAG: hypothetical protein ACLRFM_03450 [Alphaproteobacteria bacterium]